MKRRRLSRKKRLLQQELEARQEAYLTGLEATADDLVVRIAEEDDDEIVTELKKELHKVLKIRYGQHYDYEYSITNRYKIPNKIDFIESL